MSRTIAPTLAVFLLGGCHLFFPHDPRLASSESDGAVADAQQRREASVPDREASLDQRQDLSAVADVRPGPRVFTTITLVAGNGVPDYQNGSGAGAMFNQPHGLAVDASDTVYVADFKNETIRRIVKGVVDTLVGTPKQAGTDDKHLSSPSSVTATPSGEIYVADFGNNAVRRVVGGTLVTVASGFQSPSDLVMDTQGMIYLAEWGGALSAFKPPGPATLLAANPKVALPHMLALDEAARTLYVTDWSLGNVWVVDVQKGSLDLLTDSSGSALVLETPAGIALDAARRRLYVTEAVPGRIHAIDLDTRAHEVIVGTGAAGSLGSVVLKQPEGLAVDAQGRLYVSEFYGHKIWRVE